MTGLLIAVVLAQYGKDAVGQYWRMETPRTEEKRTAIVVFLNEENSGIQFLKVFRQLRFARLTIRDGRNDEWLRSGRLLTEVGEFMRVLQMVRADDVRLP
jgi:hypothetical protein